MTWGQPISPVRSGTTIKPGEVTIRLLTVKSGRSYAHIHISKKLIENYRTFGHANVLPGTNEDNGKLCIEFSNSGLFIITAPPRKTARIIIPITDAMPKGYSIGATRCPEIEELKNKIIVTLPLKAWAEAIEEATDAES